jgi:hypothetical protein
VKLLQIGIKQLGATRFYEIHRVINPIARKQSLNLFNQIAKSGEKEQAKENEFVELLQDGIEHLGAEKVHEIHHLAKPIAQLQGLKKLYGART